MDLVRQSFGVCPQHDILFDTLTVREHLEFYGGLKGVLPELMHQTITTKLREVGLEEKIDAFVESLSGGQKRKLSVCIALIGNSKIIFLDEPTSGMDPVSRRQVRVVLRLSCGTWYGDPGSFGSLSHVSGFSVLVVVGFCCCCCCCCCCCFLLVGR